MCCCCCCIFRRWRVCSSNINCCCHFLLDNIFVNSSCLLAFFSCVVPLTPFLWYYFFWCCVLLHSLSLTCVVIINVVALYFLSHPSLKSFPPSLARREAKGEGKKRNLIDLLLLVCFVLIFSAPSRTLTHWLMLLFFISTSYIVIFRIEPSSCHFSYPAFLCLPYSFSILWYIFFCLASCLVIPIRNFSSLTPRTFHLIYFSAGCGHVNY